MIDVAGLRMRVVGPSDIACAPGLTEFLEPRPTPIIKHPYTAVRIVEAKCPGDCLFQDLERLIVSRDVYIDGRLIFCRLSPQPRLVPISFSMTVSSAKERKIEDERITDRKQFYREAKPHPTNIIPGPAGRKDRRENAPVEIARYDQPNGAKHQIARPGTGYRQCRSQKVQSANHEHQRRKYLKQRCIKLHVIASQPFPSAGTSRQTPRKAC
jgi:hypothetical protein